ncbi:MAG: complex I subunit 4 family protein [Chloroflexota bacterium]
MTALLLTLFLPLLGAVAILFVPRESERIIKKIALGFSLVAFVVSLFLFVGFDFNTQGFNHLIDERWIDSLDAGFRVGLDGMSLMLVLLTTFITPIAIYSSFESITKRQKEYYSMVLLLQFAMTGVFAALDLFLFYIFWELILIPMYFIIGIWGGKERIYATVKFFIFTMVGSLFMLVAIIWLGLYAGGEVFHLPGGFTANYLAIRSASFTIPLDVQLWLFWGFALSFLIKVPLFPLHTWLPDAHTEAPTAGSVILAGVLLKMGAYGLIRFNLELFPQASHAASSIVAGLAVIGIVYGALTSMVQKDIKRLVAYSSVSHLGFVVLGIFSMTEIGLQGAILQMVNHGLSTGMLFLCVGIIYERRHTREISEFGGIARVMPAYTVMFAIAMLASVGLPGLNGFVGEYLTLLGGFISPVLNSWAYSIIGATGVIFAAVYLLWMFQRVMFGRNLNPANFELKDLSTREWAYLVPIVIMIVWIGVSPNQFLRLSEAGSKALVKKLELSRTGTEIYNIPAYKPATPTSSFK